MEGTSRSNNDKETSNALNMAGNAARNNIASAPQQQSEQENSARLAAELFPSLAPMETDNNYLNLSQDTGVSPAEVNSHATSLATGIAGITVSHCPNSTQERVMTEERMVTDERMRNKAQHTPTPNPSVQNRKREQNVQINQFVDQDNVTELLTVFDQQFNMFVCAHKARDDVMIRGILNSAIHTQSMIRQLAPEDWMRRCQDWIPRDDLEEWNQEVAEKRSQRTQTSPPQSRQSSMTPVPRQHNKRPNQQRIITEPRDLSLVPVHRPQPRQGTVYQDHGLGQNQGFHPGPPPPQQQHFMNEPQRAGFQEHHQAHHQQPLPFKGDHRHQRHFEQGFQGEFQEPHPPQAHQPPHHHHPYARGAGAWRGSRRNWRNNSDPITRTMEIGEWLMRAESVVGRMQRIRGRGRGRAQYRGP
ncbi:hypothetical protein Pst134EA_030413 [Puccinia striiformis f. sp. tritici]|uniref:hypothetical protein n=1 Tax=Puccinia striiformis f. sp. tritici TaxID=168172 RepID=UPI002008BC17|nr:hypothetical protein Pst134EA_030413 [Puccinia striiformis f. sp. tritici]KAH9446496.1 hypothetical protein Pst134EA_030413 [Puccinia striiformis f. sp. tritici]